MGTSELNDRTCIRVYADPDRLKQLRGSAMANDHLVALAAFMAVLGNETRLRMLYVMWEADELCVCDLADIFGISQPAASRHMKILREKGLAEPRRDAQTIYYRVCRENPFARMLLALFQAQETDRITLNMEGLTL